MLISTAEGAGQIVSAREDTRFYDDVACLAADFAAHARDVTAFVRVQGGGWSEVRAASFVRLSGSRTAMGSGFQAYSTSEQARAADREGRTLTWDEVVALAGQHK